jgi:hypothetical protein
VYALIKKLKTRTELKLLNNSPESISSSVSDLFSKNETRYFNSIDLGLTQPFCF